MINPSWPMRPLGELFEIGAGKTMSAAAREGMNKTPFLRTSNVLWDEIDLTTVDEMMIPAAELDAKLLRTGDLLVCEGGDIGRAAIWNGAIDRVAFQNHLHRLRPIREDVDPRFYVYFLQSAFTQLGIFEGAGNNTTIPNLSRSRLSALAVPHPPLDEQRTVAGSLLKVRNAIQAQSRAAVMAVELKNSTMRQLFTRGLCSYEPTETELGELPSQWAIASIGSLFSIVQGVALKGNLSPDVTGIPFLRTSNVYWRRIDLRAVSRMLVSPDQVAGRVLMAGDLLVCEGGEIGRSAVWEGDEGVFTYQNHLHRLRPLKPHSIDPWFTMAWLEIGFRHRNIYDGAGNETTIPNLSSSRLANLRMPVPDISEQREIVAILNAIDQKIDLCRRKSAVLNDLFASLLHKLMTGQIRATDLDMSESAGGSLVEMTS